MKKIFLTSITTLLLVFNLIGQDKNQEKFLYHNLLSEWNESTTSEEIQNFENLIVEFSKSLEGFESVQFRKLVKGQFNHQMVLKFKNEESVLKAYESHPMHKKMIEFAKDHVKSFEVFDYIE